MSSRPTPPAPAPMSTKTAVKPATNSSEVHSRRRRSLPSRSTATPEMKERYTGSSGRTHGGMKESSPATNARPAADRLSEVTSTAITGGASGGPSAGRAADAGEQAPGGHWALV